MNTEKSIDIGAYLISYPLRGLSLTEFLDYKFPPIEWMLEGFLKTAQLVLVHSAAGVGKTHFAAALALAVASGGTFLKWKAPKPRRVLYVDGEMGGEEFQEVFRTCLEAHRQDNPDADVEAIANNLITIPYATMSEDIQLDIASEAGQKLLEPFLELNPELVIIDNISTLSLSQPEDGKSENASESWATTERWAMGLRRRGISVIFLHHSGKGGEQRGTSRRSVVLNTQLKLRRPDGYQMRDGLRAVIDFEKARGTQGEAVESFEFQLVSDSQEPSTWTFQALDNKDRQILDLRAEGMSYSQIAAEAKVSKSRVVRVLGRNETREEGT